MKVKSVCDSNSIAVSLCRMNGQYSPLPQGLYSKGNVVPCNFHFPFCRKLIIHQCGAESNPPADCIREADVYVCNSKEERTKSLC